MLNTKSNLNKITTKLKYLNLNEQILIHWLLKKHENIFDGMSRYYTSTEYRIELLEGTQPYNTVIGRCKS